MCVRLCWRGLALSSLAPPPPPQIAFCGLFLTLCAPHPHDHTCLHYSAVSFSLIHSFVGIFVTLVNVQCMAGEELCGEPQPHTMLAKARPALMAFYDRLKEKAFPDGPSQHWAPGCWDAKQRKSVAC